MSRQSLVNQSPNVRSHAAHGTSDRAAKTTVTLPPYDSQSYPLSLAAKRKLEELYLHHDYTKKQKLGALEERLNSQDNMKEKIEGKHKKEEEKTLELQKKVENITVRAEQALRDLIDLGDELSIQPSIMQEVAEKVNSMPTNTQTQKRGSDSVGASHEAESPTQPAGVRCVDILRAIKEKHANEYENKSMREKYAENNEYANFKGMIHDAQNQGPNARVLEHPKFWFPVKALDGNGSSRKSQINRDDDEDDEIVMTGVTTSLKCSFTLQYFEEPYSNKKCSHTYEKSAILDYLRTEGATNSQPNRRGQNKGPRTITCPTPGCATTLTPDDFFLDERIKQQVIKAKKHEAMEDEDESDIDES
ncbi:hypothetical protein BGHDH14_bgh05528 [Blumeria hordei DH14]|uniref:SP-RING-type domain-containing protein n=1 Tax=Blumeria graminis f. sp. hordei (strain DH14) TaxID=546991 RepID=N1JPS7_BLUG1|nr:hypothetical protein BGHDH14_bgh05528 [Blumeria hordei DH14]